MLTLKSKTNFRLIPTLLTDLWRHIVDDDVISNVFRKHISTEPIIVKFGTIIHFDAKKSQKNSDRFRQFWRSYDVISFWRDVIFKWRHNSVKIVGISPIFFVTFKCQKNNRANFYKNWFSRSMFSTKRRMWRHVENWWRQNSVKNFGISLIFFCDFLTSKWPIVTIFTRIAQ